MQFIYILKINNDFYVGQTIDIIQRVNAHKKITYGYIQKKLLDFGLVYYEIVADDINILYREQNIKKLSTEEKISLIDNQSEKKQTIINMINNYEYPRKDIYKEIGYKEKFFSKLLLFNMNLYEEIEDIRDKYNLGSTSSTITYLVTLGINQIKKI